MDIENDKYKLLHGDCHERLNDIEDNSLDLIISSPPYDSIRDYNSKWQLDLSKLGSQLYQKAKDGCVCAIIIQDGSKDFAKSLTSFKLAVDWCDNHSWRLFETCIYYRHGRPGAWWSKRFRVDHEYIFFFLKGDRPKYFNKEPLKIKSIHPGSGFHGTQRTTDGLLNRRVSSNKTEKTKCRGTIWKYSTSNTERNKIKMQHPATFPDALALDIIKCFSKEGDKVLDPMFGSGTTVRMALTQKRYGMGIEINDEYFDIARKICEKETNQIF